MNSEKIEILSKLVTSILEESDKLKVEVKRLNEKIEDMDAENRAVLERNLKAQTDLKKVIRSGRLQPKNGKGKISGPVQS